MRAKSIIFSLSDKKSRDRAIKELEEYRDSLISKNDLFIKRLAEIGVTAAESILANNGEGDTSRNARFSMVFNTSEGQVEGLIIISSDPHVDKDGRKFYPHLAWEFGAGIFYNNGNINPKASEMGMGVGTFPNQKHALDDYWWYRDNDGEFHISYGTKATMPMFNASKTIIEQIDTIAREVFSGQ